MIRQKANEDIRQAAAARGLYLWEVARRANISQATITAWLRVPVTPEQRDLLMKAIEGGDHEDNTTRKTAQ